jgi:chemotaxis regulatin CheY-phosphate phosphatase CheZ
VINMAGRQPPEINLELSGGSLTIRTAEAIYNITATTVPGGAPALPPASTAQPRSLPPSAAAEPDLDDWPEVDTAAPPADAAPVEAAAGAPEDEEYYRDLSHDMFREVGRLARRLSMSIRDVQVDKIEDMDLESMAGEQLEQAKDQLESVVKMTEQATLQIMDQGESIQGAIDQARSIMEQINTSTEEAGSEARGGGDPEALEKLKQAIQDVNSFLEGLGDSPLADLAALAEAATSELGSAPEAPAEAAPAEVPPEPAAPAGPYYQFPLDLVFQTTYELCTNETVKKHIKAMWDVAAKAFDAAAIEKGMNSLVTEGPDEDNFLNLDLKGVLKVLFGATGEDRFKQIIKKMASTVDQIFLEPSLPLEAMPGEAPAAAAPPPPAPAPAAPAAPAGPSPEAIAKVAELAEAIKAKSGELTPPQLPGELSALLEQALAGSAGGEPSNTVQPELVQELDKSMGVIVSSVNSIIEALSFQDLSGQAIYRIVRLLTDFQVQLLAMVVSFGSKLKTKAEKKDVTPDQSEKMAQEEVDKALESLGVGGAEEGEDEGAGGELDQDSVNSLLDSMGF